MEKYGRLTLPTDLDVIDQTIELKNKLGADAIRDCDGTDMPQELMNLDAKIYATYYTTRKDNEWAEANTRRDPTRIFDNGPLYCS